MFLVSLIVTGLLIDKLFVNKKKDLPQVLGKSQELKQGSDIIAESLKTGEKIGGEVLGQSTSFISDIAAKASSTAGDIIYQNTIGKLVDQIDKLPKDQLERVREQICK